MENRSKKAWAFPHRSGDDPGGSRAVREPKIFVLEVQVRGGGGPSGTPISGPLRSRKVRSYGGMGVWGGTSNKVISNTPTGLH